MKKKKNNGLQLVQNLHGQICGSLLFQFVDIEFGFRFSLVVCQFRCLFCRSQEIVKET